MKKECDICGKEFKPDGGNFKLQKHCRSCKRDMNKSPFSKYNKFNRNKSISDVFIDNLGNGGEE